MMPTRYDYKGRGTVDREEILTQIETLLRQHKEKLRGSIHQEGTE
jgi:hypothetical protein